MGNGIRAVIAILGLATSACASERPPINRVQPNAVAKSFFVGADLANAADDPEFYMRTTLVDAAYGAAQDGLFTSGWAQPVTRIRWKIESDMLVARLAYERIADSDGKGSPTEAGGVVRKLENDGQVVAAYAITSHFDIRRAYHPSTGEEENILEENTTDRPWNEREYMRVDWSKNLMTSVYDLDTLSLVGINAGIEYEPASYTVLDPADPDAPAFDPANGYFDVTNKVFAKPALVDVSSLGWGTEKVPACWLGADFAGGGYPVADCNPVELTLRQSFRRVVDTDYEPFSVDGIRNQAFGIFTTDRLGYERDYGLSDDKWYRFASRYNLWERSHVYTDAEAMEGPMPCATEATTEFGSDATLDPIADPNRDDSHVAFGAGANEDGFFQLEPGPNGTADECEMQGALPGSRCDVFRKQCTIPYAQRTPKTTAWYLTDRSTQVIQNLRRRLDGSADIPERIALGLQIDEEAKKGEGLFEATNWAALEWDLALKASVATARYAECRRLPPTQEQFDAALAHSPGLSPGQVVKLANRDDCFRSFPMWVGQQEDADEAVAMSRELDHCRRTKGWESEDCLRDVESATDRLSRLRTGKGSEEPGGDRSAWAMRRVVSAQTMIVLCHNPVAASDAAACGEGGLSPRKGDLRYNTVLAVDGPQDPSPWGIMSDGDDPLTGEKVAASINVFTHVTDMAAQNLVDLVRYVNGELSAEDITDGDTIQDWVKAGRLDGGSSGPVMTPEEVDTRLASMTGLDAEAFAEAARSEIPRGVERAIADKQRELADAAASTEALSVANLEALQRMRLARGTSVESTLVNAPMLELAGFARDRAPVGALLDRASPLSLNNPKVRSELRRMRENGVAARGGCILHDAPAESSALPGIAKALKDKFPVLPACTLVRTTHCETPKDRFDRYARMKDYVARRYQYSLVAHEMGHSVGLRHNFVSSAASLHYRPQYWQLRARVDRATPAVRPECRRPRTESGAGDCMGPRYFDPTTPEEKDQLVWAFMQSSVMDYAGDVVQNMIGLGAYDFAAARMFYGDVVSLYDVRTEDGGLDADYLAGGRVGVGVTNVTDSFGGLGGVKYSVKAGGLPDDSSCGTTAPCSFHYAQLPKNYPGLLHGCYPIKPEAPSFWDEARDGRYSPLLDGLVVTVDKKTLRCRTLEVDYAAWDDLRTPTPDEIGGGYYRGGNSVDPATGRVRVPYSFATDHWADVGNVSVFRHDNGADPYEQVMFLITSQESRHILDNYRRGRTSFSVLGAATRSFERYGQKLLGIASGIGFYSNIYKDFATSAGISYDSLWPRILDGDLRVNMIAATVAFDHMTRQLARPEPGNHYALAASFEDPTLRSALDPDGRSGTTVVTIPNGGVGYANDLGFGGHPLENALSSEHGDWNTDFTTNAGSYYDKIHAAILMSESEDRFISQSRQDFYDARFRAVGMADVVPEGFRRVLANALTNDRGLLAPHVAAKASGAPLVEADPRDPAGALYPRDPVGWTSFWPAKGPVRCFSRSGSNVCAGLGTNVDAAGGERPPEHTVGIDPQIGWEVQKFLIAWSLAYVRANERAEWIDMMRIYRLGLSTDPAFERRIEWQDPFSGQLYYAKTYGKECLFPKAPGGTPATKEECEGREGRWLERGIAARVLEYANALTEKAFELDTSEAASGHNAFGRTLVLLQPDGTPIVRPDAAVTSLSEGQDDGETCSDTNACRKGLMCDGGVCEACNQGVEPTCKPAEKYDSHWAVELDGYRSVPNFLWEVVVRYGLGTPDQLGVDPG